MNILILFTWDGTFTNEWVSTSSNTNKINACGNHQKTGI